MGLGFGLISGQVAGGGDWQQVYDEMLSITEHAEAIGFDSVWTTEHHFVDDGYMPSLLPVAAAMAARTSRIQIGTGVMLAPLHHPLRLAEDAATVQLLSQGRLALGLGLGWSGVEFEAFGADRSKRGKAMTEMLEILPKAWSGEPFRHTGEIYDLPEIGVRPVPHQKIPILIGGSAPAALRRAARLANGVFANAPVEGYLDQVRIVKEELERNGRDPADFEWIHYSVLWPCDDQASGWREASEHVWRMMWKYSDMEASARRSLPAPTPPPFDPSQEPALLERALLVDTPERIVEHLLDIRERSGVATRFVARSFFPSLALDAQMTLMDRLATEVAPHL